MPSAVMHFYSGQPMHFYSGVDIFPSPASYVGEGRVGADARSASGEGAASKARMGARCAAPRRLGRKRGVLRERRKAAASRVGRLRSVASNARAVCESFTPPSERPQPRRGSRMET